MSFKNIQFNDHIHNNLEDCGYITPTPIQKQALGPVLEGRDLLGLAQTGTGKTAAFVLPIIQHLCTGPGNKVRALIISPTRELTEQTHDYVIKLARNTRLRSVAIYGGVSKQAQINKIRQGAEIVVACPGRLLDLLVNDKAINLSSVETLVLDEADHMFDQGFLPDIRRILKALPKRRQNLVFSATMPTEIRSLVEDVLVDPVKVQVDHQKAIATISHALYRVEPKNKAALLRKILKEKQIESAIVFTRTKHKARKLATQLEKAGHRATSLQGNMSQSKRQFALNGFKSGRYNIMVATDIAARGIDVSNISHVINFDMPENIETYTHRTGRTGRANKTGAALTFASSDNQRMIKALDRAFGKKLVIEKSSESAGVPRVRVEDSKPAVRAEAPGKLMSNAKLNRDRKQCRGKKSSQRNRAASFDFGL